jgi:hypothetical protein
VSQHKDEDLNALLQLIARWGAINTYPDRPDLAHSGCLELEKRDLLYRFRDEPDHIIWKVKEGQPKPGPSETKDDLPDTLLGHPIKYVNDLPGGIITFGPFEFYGPEDDAINKT